MNTQDVLEPLLKNEADMAFARRARKLWQYLDLQSGDQLLDCGCGMGFYLMAASKLPGIEAVGIDEDPKRVEQARQHATVVQGSILDLPFESDTFSKVLLSEVLEHVEDAGGLLKELHRVSKPGAVLAISVPHAKYPFWWDPINAVWTTLGGSPIRAPWPAGIWSNHVRLYTPEQLIAEVEASGWQVNQMEQATHYCFPFIHFIVYGIGKPLIESRLIPDVLRRNNDRMLGERNDGNAFDPGNLLRRIFRFFDRKNDLETGNTPETFVNVLLKATRK